MLNAVESRREVAGDQRRFEHAVQVHTPRRAVIRHRRMTPRAIGRDHCRAGHRMVQSGRHVLEVRDQLVGRRVDPEEIVHILVVVVVDLGHPLGHERNGGDAASPSEGTDTRAVTPEPRLERELLSVEPERGAEGHVGARGGELDRFVRRVGQDGDRQRVDAGQQAVVGRELQHVGALHRERGGRGQHRGVCECY